jgi:hypothetical protein
MGPSSTNVESAIEELRRGIAQQEGLIPSSVKEEAFTGHSATASMNCRGNVSVIGAENEPETVSRASQFEGLADDVCVRITA